MASTIRVADQEGGSVARGGLTVTDLLLLCMALIWGVNFAVVKYGTGQLAPLAFTSARITLAAVVLLALVALGGGAMPRGRDRLALLGLGALGNGVYQVLFVLGIARTRAGDAALLIAATPAFMAMIGRMRGTEHTGARGALGIALSLVGIALVIFGDSGGDAGGTSSLLGDALILAGSLCWSLYSVLLKPYADRVDGVALSAVTMVGGAIPLLLVSAPAIVATPWDAVSSGGWAAVLYSGILGMVVAYLCWYRGVRVLGPTRTAMYANLQPVIALGVAWATLHESPHLPQLAGAALIMGGLVLTRLSSPSTTRE